jgi:hypothetical protein
MTVFIEATTDPFVDRRRRIAAATRERGRNVTSVRRPLRGFELKEDTHAVIRVALSNGEFLPVIDAAGDIVTSRDGKAYTTQYTNFLVQSVVEERHEKQQIVETFGDAYIFFYGEAPRLIQVSGVLLNTNDFNWRSEWWENYERYFRGTRLVENGARLYMIYDDVIIEGYMLQAQAVDNSQTPYTIPLTFQMFVTGYTNISLVGDPNYPVPEGQIDYTSTTSYDEALRQWEESRNLQREVSIDAVRQANFMRYQQAQVLRTVEGYLGEGQLLASAIQQGLSGGDPSITGFLQRSQGAIFGLQRLTSSVIGNVVTSASTEGATDYTSTTRNSERYGLRPNPFSEGGRSLRSTFRDNTDEFLGQDVPSADELASPLSMADRWLKMDRAVDNSLVGVIDSVVTEFGDVMGRIGRASVEMSQSQGPSRRADGVFQTGSTRQLRPGIVRDIPFGIAAFIED